MTPADRDCRAQHAPGRGQGRAQLHQGGAGEAEEAGQGAAARRLLLRQGEGSAHRPPLGHTAAPAPTAAPLRSPTSSALLALPAAIVADASPDSCHDAPAAAASQGGRAHCLPPPSQSALPSSLTPAATLLLPHAAAAASQGGRTSSPPKEPAPAKTPADKRAASAAGAGAGSKPAGGKQVSWFCRSRRAQRPRPIARLQFHSAFAVAIAPLRGVARRRLRARAAPPRAPPRPRRLALRRAGRRSARSLQTCLGWASAAAVARGPRAGRSSSSSMARPRARRRRGRPRTTP